MRQCLAVWHQHRYKTPSGRTKSFRHFSSQCTWSTGEGRKAGAWNLQGTCHRLAWLRVTHNPERFRAKVGRDLFVHKLFFPNAFRRVKFKTEAPENAHPTASSYRATENTGVGQMLTSLVTCDPLPRAFLLHLHPAQFQPSPFFL